MSNNKSSASGSFSEKINNLTDTNLLLTITIVVFFLMFREGAF